VKTCSGGNYGKEHRTDMEGAFARETQAQLRLEQQKRREFLLKRAGQSTSRLADFLLMLVLVVLPLIVLVCISRDRSSVLVPGYGFSMVVFTTLLGRCRRIEQRIDAIVRLGELSSDSGSKSVDGAGSHVPRGTEGPAPS
jgi:hypothetical protein